VGVRKILRTSLGEKHKNYKRVLKYRKHIIQGLEFSVKREFKVILYDSASMKEFHMNKSQFMSLLI
jgi:hypothetical protein